MDFYVGQLFMYVEMYENMFLFQNNVFKIKYGNFYRSCISLNMEMIIIQMFYLFIILWKMALNIK